LADEDFAAVERHGQAAVLEEGQPADLVIDARRRLDLGKRERFGPAILGT